MQGSDRVPGFIEIPVIVPGLLVPEGYVFIAQDLLGGIYAYKLRPHLGECSWITQDGDGLLITMGRENEYWRNTLTIINSSVVVEYGILKIRRGNANARTA